MPKSKEHPLPKLAYPQKAAATVYGFASNAFRSEAPDWTGLVEWIQRNPARLIYGVIGIWLSVYVFLSHKTNTETFIAEHHALRAGEAAVDLLMGVWLVACIFSFFSERAGAKWLRRSLVISISSAWVLDLWDLGAIGIVWIALAWVLFIVAEHAVVALDEASRRKRPLKYILFTVAVSIAYTSVLAVLLLDSGNLLGYWPLLGILWLITALVMGSAYRDRSDPQGATYFDRAGLKITVFAVLTASLLSEIMEIALGIPADVPSRAWWIEENWGMSSYWASYVNLGVTCGLLGIGLAMTWLAKSLYRSFR